MMVLTQTKDEDMEMHGRLVGICYAVDIDLLYR